MLKEKVFRDPIHRYIVVDDAVIWELINTYAFQRLNNIRQLGGAYQVFHGAVHTRFGHSLGAYAIAREMYEKVPGLKDKLNDYERIVLYCAALLHDLGHAPFSHAAEAFLAIDHEQITAKIILEDYEIRAILDRFDVQLARDIVAVLNKTYHNPLLSSIISSQVDVDRMDYLLRDAYYAGVPYGEYDKDRLIHVMNIIGDQIVYNESGVYVLENFMISRYHMRQQVYNNTKGQVFQSYLYLSVERFRKLWSEGRLVKTSLYQKFNQFLSVNYNSDIQEFVAFDDHLFLSVQHFFAEEQDPFLAVIAHKILHRNLSKIYELDNQETFDKITKKIIQAREADEELGYLLFTEAACESDVYKYKDEEQIKILMADGEIANLGDVSAIMNTWKKENSHVHYYIFVDRKYIESEIETIDVILQRLKLL